MYRFLQGGLSVLIWLSFFSCRWQLPPDSTGEVGTELSQDESSLALTSPDLTNEGNLTEGYFCDGAIPQLAWTDPPEGTLSFALIVVSSWEGGNPVFNALVMDIPAELASLEGKGQGFTSLILGLRVHSTGRLSLSNLFLDEFYYGPCEDYLSETETRDSVRMEVTFTLYALNVDSLIDDLFTQEFGTGRFTNDTDLMLAEIEAHSLEQSELTVYADLLLTN